MANAAQFTIIITALDKASAQIRHVNQTIGGLTAPFANVGKSIAALGEAAGMNKLVAAAENAGSKVVNLGSKISGLIGPLAALGGAASVAGLYEIAKGASDWGHELYLATQKTNVAADALAKLHFIGETAGAGPELMDKALFKLNLIIQKGPAAGKEIVGMFRHVGIAMRDSTGHVRNVTDVWKDLSEAVQRNPMFRQRIVADAFGARFGAAMIPVLMKGRAETDRLMATFEKMYGKITPAVIAASEKGHEAFEQLKLSASGLKFTIGSALFPALEKIIEPLTGWIAANRVLISQRVGEWAKNVATYIESIDWKAVGATVMDFAHSIAAVGKALGPVWTTVAVAGVIFAPFIAAALQAGVALVKLGFAAGGVAVRLIAIPLASLVVDIAATIPMIGSMADAWAALDLVMDANPIGLVVVAVAALAGAAYLVYEHWTPIKNFFIGLWDYIPAIFKWGYEHILPWIPGGGLVKLIVDNWKPLTHFFDALWKGLTGIFQRAWNILKPIIDGVVGGAKWLAEHTGLLDITQAVANVTTTVVHTVIHAVRDIEQHGEWISLSRDPARNARALQAMTFFKGKGWSANAAAAITGNLLWEGAGLNPRAVGDHGAARGIAQWHK